jgi:DNA-binding transcriptional MocR family regulator
VQHGAAGAHLSHVHAPHVRVGADPGDDLLLLAQHGDGPDAVPQGGGLFKVQLLRRLLHLHLQLRRQLAVVAGENALRLPDAALRSRAAEQGVRLALLSDYYSVPETAPQHIVVVNYSGIDLERLPEGLRRLAQAWEE